MKLRQPNVGRSQDAQRILLALRKAPPPVFARAASLSLRRAPTAHEQLPPLHDLSWYFWAEVILDEAKLSISGLSKRQWVVVHPDDNLVVALAARLEAGKFSGSDVETPRLVKWHSTLDNRDYILIESMSLPRQPIICPAGLS